MIYLGRLAYRRAESLKIVSCGSEYNVLNGTVCWKEKQLKNPVIEMLPSEHERQDGRGNIVEDIRTNVLGATAMLKLGMLDSILG